MNWALIIDGHVAEITDIDPEGRFHPSLVWVPAGPNVNVGNEYIDGEFTEPPEPEISPEEMRAQKVSLVQVHLDAAAQAINYDSIATAISYAEEPVVPKFQAEGQALRAWRSLVWEKCYQIFDDVQAGNRPVPSDEELISELPALQLPQGE